ncbi:MAG TPA: hypothetical protein VFU26_14565 [Gaiellaceae bacterium]|nr:hypothetical protein [Gaiellaceae bacterium]
MALALGLAAIATLPVAMEVASRSKRITLLGTAYAIPLAFVLSLVALLMARRARRNLRWLQLREGGTGVATTALVVAAIALCITIAAALSVGFYGLVLLYQHSR